MRKEKDLKKKRKKNFFKRLCYKNLKAKKKRKKAEAE